MSARPKETKRRKLPALPDVPEQSYSVEERELSSLRPFFRIREDHPVWGVVASLDAWDSTLDPLLKGAIVRVDPPLDADPRVVDCVKSCCERAGAEKVRCSPIRTSAVLVEAAPTGLKAPKVREVVAELVGASNVDDKEALSAFCESVMAAQGVG